jgi:hypothetical protein
VVGFYQPIVMNDAEDGGEIDEAVEALPVLSSEAAYGPSGGGEGERDHEDEGGESNSDEGAFEYVFPDFMEIEEFVEPDVGEEMQSPVKEGEEPEHAAERDEPVLAGYAAERGNGESDEEEEEGPVSGGVGDELDGVGAERVVEIFPEEASDREEGG